MRYIERQGRELAFRTNGETIQITPWGRDSLRIRAAQMAERGNRRVHFRRAKMSGPRAFGCDSRI